MSPAQGAPRNIRTFNAGCAFVIEIFSILHLHTLARLSSLHVYVYAFLLKIQQALMTTWGRLEGVVRESLVAVKKSSAV